MVEVEEPAYYLIEGTMVGHVELCRVLAFIFWFYITADAGTRASTDLRDTEFQEASAALLALTSRDDHACIRNSYSDDSHYSVEDVVRHSVLEVGCVDVVCHT